MPIIRSMNKLVYFSHIPKCGGASVEAYLHAVCNGQISFLDNKFRLVEEEGRWSKSPPQHIDGFSLSRLFPASFFDAYFAIVRDPISKFKSAFHFQKYVEHTIESDVRINEFVTSLDANNIARIGFFDGHFMPQFMFLYPNVSYKFFRLEEGMVHVKNYIDVTLFGNVLERAIPHANVKKPVSNLPPESLTSTSIETLHKLYQKDYELFGYHREDEGMEVSDDNPINY